MTAILDPAAPSVSAEYARYIDGDLLGKVLARNLLVNRLGYPPESIFIPLGRYGDAKVKYAKPGVVAHDPGDGHVTIDGKNFTFEIKFARINIANRSSGGKTKNWAFVNLLKSPAKAHKKYDLLIAIGALTLGLEDERYWEELRQVNDDLLAQARPAKIDAMPHEPEFLSICSFFILPMREIPTNYFRVNVGAIEDGPFAKYRAWGYDEERCKEVCNRAVQTSNRP